MLKTRLVGRPDAAFSHHTCLKQRKTLLNRAGRPLQFLRNAQDLHRTLDKGLVLIVPLVQGVLQILLLQDRGDEQGHHELADRHEDDHLAAVLAEFSPSKARSLTRRPAATDL